MSGFIKVDCNIRTSSIWSEDSDTRICWFTLLTMAGPDGFVAATAPGIAHEARISLDKTREALAVFENPDPDSKNPANDGRRIRRIVGGYQILNFEFYRNKDYSTARVRRYRERMRQSVGTHDHDAERAAQQPDPVAAFMEHLPEELQPLREDLERYYRQDLTREDLDQKLLAYFKDDPELASSTRQFVAGLKPDQRTPEMESRHRLNSLIGRFHIPFIE